MGSCVSSSLKKKREGTFSHTNFEMENLDPLNYIPESAKGQMRSETVIALHLIAYSVIATGGNHWNICLQTREGYFIRLEFVPGAFPGREGFLGRLDIIQHSYDITRKSHKTVAIPTQCDCTVADFLDTIVHADNARYEFTTEGRGCGGWVRDQFNLFVQVGLLRPGSEAIFEAALHTAWENHSPREPWPVTYGTYLKDRTRK